MRPFVAGGDLGVYTHHYFRNPNVMSVFSL